MHSRGRFAYNSLASLKLASTFFVIAVTTLATFPVFAVLCNNLTVATGTPRRYPIRDMRVVSIEFACFSFKVFVQMRLQF